jgi:hypothetical protein
MKIILSIECARELLKTCGFDLEKPSELFEQTPQGISLDTRVLSILNLSDAALLSEAATSIHKVLELCRTYESAIRAHRDERGDDRCWRDDEKLYSVLPEGYTPPVRDCSVELDNCRRYINSRHNPKTEYISPQLEIGRLRRIIKLLIARNW